MPAEDESIEWYGRHEDGGSRHRDHRTSLTHTQEDGQYNGPRQVELLLDGQRPGVVEHVEVLAEDERPSPHTTSRRLRHGRRGGICRQAPTSRDWKKPTTRPLEKLPEESARSASFFRQPRR